MTSPRILKRLGMRQGFRLTDVVEVALPTYEVHLKALTLAYKPLPPIAEVALRAISAGLQSRISIRDFLGVSNRTLDDTFVRLAQAELIALTGDQLNPYWRVTEKGRITAQQMTLTEPEERTFTLHFDAILWRPVLHKSLKRFRGAELLEQGLRPIELYPPRRPSIGDFRPSAVEKIIEDARPSHMPRRNVLGVVELQSIRKKYVAATAALYRSWTGSNYQIGFLVNNARSQPHEEAFEATEAFRRLTREWLEFKDIDDELRRALNDASNFELGSSIPEVQEAAYFAQAEIADREDQLTNTAADALQLSAEIDALRAEVDRYRSELAKVPGRHIYTIDHPPLLEDALTNARRRVMIFSPWIRGDVVDQEFIAKLRKLLERGVDVYIGYGIKEEHTVKLKPADEAGRRGLQDLSIQFSNFVLKRLGNTHAKVLIKDSEFAAVTSFNWLSFRGDLARTFRDEQGALFLREVDVDNKWDDLIGRFLS